MPVANTASPKVSPLGAVGLAAEGPAVFEQAVRGSCPRPPAARQAAAHASFPSITVGRPRRNVATDPPRQGHPGIRACCRSCSPGRRGLDLNHVTAAGSTRVRVGRLAHGSIGSAVSAESPPIRARGVRTSGRRSRKPSRDRRSACQTGHDRQRCLQPEHARAWPRPTRSPCPRRGAERGRWRPRRWCRQPVPATERVDVGLGAQRRVDLEDRVVGLRRTTSVSSRWCGVTSAVTSIPACLGRPDELDRAGRRDVADVQPGADVGR